MLSNQETLLLAGLAIPLVCFVVLALFGSRIGKPLSGWLAAAGVAASAVLSGIVVNQWFVHGIHDAAHTFTWATIGSVPITVGVRLDALTVIMYFMVSVVSTCIFVFAIGYMAGHSDEIDGQSKFHRFFTFLCLFGFSMLGLVLSNSILFLFVFWELVGLCSYFLIGFYFHKKSASNAAIKAFVVNRVGDFGFLIGLMMVLFYLRDASIDGAAAAFRQQFADNGPLFTATMLGVPMATWMGIFLFCGAVGKSAQFPLHVWLPDAMEGPTPVSALIHAATMVAAGVYLVARIFVLLTPGAQAVIAVIGCITLAMAALVAIVQTDIKRVLAYSTLSQLGYMIFGMGVGAWVGALFHLLTHAFFKSLLFLGSGQVIEGCHHEQDMRHMGGLFRKMPVTALTFLVGVLAISGAGLPGVEIGGHRIGLGGFFSKDEILAVAYHRAYTLGDTPSSEHATANAEGAAQIRKADDAWHATPIASPGPIRKALFWIPIIIAYVTPFYMMRAWWLTFMGKPRDKHVHEHAHESPLMYVPLIALSIGTFVASYYLFRPMVEQAAPGGFLVQTFNPELHAGEAAHVVAGLPIAAAAHHALGPIVGFAFIIGFVLAIGIYRNGLTTGEKIARAFPVPYRILCNKFYFDAIYGRVFVGGLMALKSACGWFDANIVDGLVNLVGWIGRVSAKLSGEVLDRGGAMGSPSETLPGGRAAGFVALVACVALSVILFTGGHAAAGVLVLVAAWLLLGVDGIVNDLALGAFELADALRRPQTGRIRNYVLFAAGGAAVGLLIMVLVR